MTAAEGRKLVDALRKAIWAMEEASQVCEQASVAAEVKELEMAEGVVWRVLTRALAAMET